MLFACGIQDQASHLKINLSSLYCIHSEGRKGLSAFSIPLSLIFKMDLLM